MQYPSAFGRISVVLAVFVFATGFFLFKLFQRQVLEHQDYAQAAEQQSTTTVAHQAARGQILAKDKDGKLYTLAASEERYRVEVSPRLIKNKEKMASLLSGDLPQLTSAEIFEKINNNNVYIPALATDLDAATANKLEERNYVGIFIRPEMVRVYPEADAMAPQVLGFVGSDGHGKYGVEAVHDAVLRGKAGSEKSKKDSFGRLIDVLGNRQATPGKDILLTLDYNLQFNVEKHLREALTEYKADAGSIVVMNPKNGAILAVASQPVFDPNKFREVRGDEQSRFLLPAASNVYEPGSVIKPITMAMALDMKLVEPDTTEVFGKSVKVLDKEIFNAEFKTYGRETMTQVLENSDNVAMVWLSEKIGTEKEREYFDKFGFGKKSGVDIIGEQSGLLRPIKEWNSLLRATAAFGQGMSANTLQLASAYSVLGNGGKTVTPHLVEQIMFDGELEAVELPEGQQIISSEAAAQVREMLFSVVELGHGKRAAVEGVRVGGKTGTAQVPDPAGGYYEDRHIGTFAGLFPVDDPEFVMVVRLDNPKTVRFAESSAAPVFGKIANWITNYYQLR